MNTNQNIVATQDPVVELAPANEEIVSLSLNQLSMVGGGQDTATLG